MAGNRCKVCMHPERVAIDRTVALGAASLRTIAKQHGLTISAVQRHVVRHLQVQGTATPASVAQEVVNAVRRDREQEQGVVARMWERRLNESYEAVRRGMDRAEQDAELWPQVARFGMTANSLIETGLRACGVLAGGPDNHVTVNVEHLVVLPSVPMQPSPVTIDVTETKPITS
jgi:hypothetical protein